MINFIVVDDNEKIRSIVVKNIAKEMLNSPVESKTYSFGDYDKEFFSVMNSKLTNKVYLLDIETKTASGIDIARIIRKRDVDSVIIFVTAHDELSYLVSKEELLFLTFICKFDNFEEKIRSAVVKALEVMNHKMVIRFQDKGTIYTIPINDILYVARDSYERKCVIKTDYAEYKVNKTLIEFEKILGDKFKRSHRACLVNTARIRSISSKNNQIFFDSGQVCNFISAGYKKELVQNG